MKLNFFWLTAAIAAPNIQFSFFRMIEDESIQGYVMEIFNEIPEEKREETRLSFAILNRLDALLSTFFGQPINAAD